MRPTLLALGVAIALAGCAQRNVTIPPAGAVASPSTGTTAPSTISITIPAPQQTSSAARKASYISTASNSMVLTPQGQPQIVMPLSTTTPGCRTLNGARICTFRISLPTGTYSMRVALYATADGTGTPLAIVTTTTTIVANTTNNIDFTLNAVLSAVSVALIPDGVFTSGTAATKTINVGAFDAGGATIVVGSDALVDSSGSPVTVRFGNTDTSGATSIAPTIAGSTPSVLSYNGGTPNGTTILALATNSANASVATAHAAFSVGGTSGCGAAASSQRRTAAASCDLPSHFLSSPLDCGSPYPQCTSPYPLGVYTPQRIITVLDHSLTTSPPYPSAVYADLNHVIVAFNGEYADTTPQPSDKTCVGGAIHLNTLSYGGPESLDLVRQGVPGVCDLNYTSYDGHPGYDYLAQPNTPVYPAGTGTVVDTGDATASLESRRCIRTPRLVETTCADWGLVGIDHHNGYVSQYMHLSNIFVTAGTEITPDWITQRRPIGLSGQKTPSDVHVGPHLHFEVLAHIPKFGTEPGNYNYTHWAFVDPYGWTGGRGLKYSESGDPIYSAALGIPPMQLWK